MIGETVDLIDVQLAATLISDLAKSASNIKSAEPDWRSVFHTYDDFENAPNLSFAINRFLQNDGATMIGGLSGHGKTLVALSIAKALLAGPGTKLWNLFDVEEKAVRIVYLIPECVIGPFKHRLKNFGLYSCLAPNDGRLLVRTLSLGPTPPLSDSRILFAVKGAYVFLDTAVRFSGAGDENSANDNQKGLAADVFGLLAAGARSVIAIHHAPKTFANSNTMTLESVLRGSSDIGAMLSTCWAVKQIDASQNILHIENVKPRDFQPCGAFQIIGRPAIDEAGDFQLHKSPEDCLPLMEEIAPLRKKGGAPKKPEREERVILVRKWIREDSNLTIDDIRKRFRKKGHELSHAVVKNYRRDAMQSRFEGHE